MGLESYRELAPVYDRLMADVDYDRWASGVLKRLEGRRTVADVACGTGAIAIRLAKAGLKVTGVDLSEDMLMQAQENARACGVRVPFIRQDARRLDLMHPVQAVTMCCDGVNYLVTEADVSACFSRVYANLQPDGLFLFDVSSPYKLETQLGDQFYGMTGEDVCYLWKNARDEARHLVTMDLTFFVREGKNLYRRFDEVHVQRAHRIGELTKWLETAGFRRVTCMGDLVTGASPSPESARLYFTAVK